MQKFIGGVPNSIESCSSLTMVWTLIAMIAIIISTTQIATPDTSPCTSPLVADFAIVIMAKRIYRDHQIA